MGTRSSIRSGGGYRWVAVALLAVALVLAACGSDDRAGEPDDAEGGGSDDPGDEVEASDEAASVDESSEGASVIRIGLVTKTETNPFFVKMREAAQEIAEEHRLEITALAGAFDGDNEGQVRAIENLIAQGVDGIMIVPNNSTGVLGAIEQARAQGIVVIALDTATEPEDAVDATFATDNFEAGRLQGLYVRAALGNAEPKLIMMDGTPGGTVDTLRHNGFLDGFSVVEGDAAILGAENTQGDQNTAQTAMENLLQRNDDVNAVYTINEPAARGAFAALEARGIADQVIIGSIDGGCQGVQDVADGLYAATVMQFPSLMVAEGIAAIVSAVSGGEAPSGFVDTGAVVITDTPIDGIDSEDTSWGLDNCWG